MVATILTARTPLRIGVEIDAHELLGVEVPPSTSHYPLRIRLVPKGAATAELGAKSLRRAQAAVRQHGPEAVVVQVSWRLQGTQMLDPVVTVQLKLPPKAAGDGDAENVLEAAE